MRGPAVLSGSMCGLSLVFAMPAHAEHASGTLGVSLTVLPGCSVHAAPLAFVARAGAPAEAEASIGVRCSSETGVEVSLDNGRHAAGGQRRLASAAGDAVPYAVYSDAARTRAWTGSPVIAGVAPERPLRLVAYGRIEPAATAVPAGDYSDTVTITVAF